MKDDVKTWFVLSIVSMCASFLVLCLGLYWSWSNDSYASTLLFFLIWFTGYSIISAMIFMFSIIDKRIDWSK